MTNNDNDKQRQKSNNKQNYFLNAYHESWPPWYLTTWNTLTNWTTLKILIDQWVIKKIIAEFALFTWSCQHNEMWAKTTFIWSWCQWWLCLNFSSNSSSTIHNPSKELIQQQSFMSKKGISNKMNSITTHCKQINIFYKSLIVGLLLAGMFYNLRQNV